MPRARSAIVGMLSAATLGVLGVNATATPSHATLTVEVALAKPEYLDGEPLQLCLTIWNRGDRGVRRSYDYPCFGIEDTGIALRGVDDPVSGARSPLRPIVREVVHCDGGSFVCAGMHVGAGSDRIVRVYLDQFLERVPPGRHRIAYRVRIAFHTESPSVRLDAAAEGTLDILVTEPREDRRDLDAVYAHFVKTWRESHDDEWLAGLLTVRHAAVVPILVSLVREGCRNAVPALGRFARHPGEARIALVNATRDDWLGSEALDELARLGIALSRAHLQEFLASDEGPGTWAILAYATRVPRRGYLEPLLRARQARPAEDEEWIKKWDAAIAAVRAAVEPGE